MNAQDLPQSAQLLLFLAELFKLFTFVAAGICLFVGFRMWWEEVRSLRVIGPPARPRTVAPPARSPSESVAAGHGDKRLEGAGFNRARWVSELQREFYGSRGLKVDDPPVQTRSWEDVQ